MDETRFAVLVGRVAALLSRRHVVQAAGGATIAVLGERAWRPGGAEAKARRKGKRRKKRKCRAPKAKCGETCVPLDTSTNCGRCGNACAEGTSCFDGVCCAYPLCRGECRGECSPPDANYPFPRRLTYAGAIMPSVGQNQLDADVRAAYVRWKGFYLVQEARDQNENQVFRIAFGKTGPKYETTVSEGLGFGMIIVAIMAGYDAGAREIFDGLWRFRLAHPSANDSRLMDWKAPGDGANASAFDGDADIAYALLLAEAQWGNHGAVNYGAAFAEVVAGVLASTIGPQSRLPMLGDWVDPNGGKYNQNTPRTSDFMLGHFRAFGRATGDKAWTNVLAACQSVVASL